MPIIDKMLNLPSIAVALIVLFILVYRFINKKRNIFTKYHLYALILNLCSIYVFSKMVEDVVNRENITRLDIWMNTKMVLLQNDLLNKIMIFITNIVSPVNLFILSVVLFGILLYKKRWYNSLLLIFSLISGLLTEVLIKLIVHRMRPENALINVSGYSFPSGHATMAIIFFSLVIYSFKDDIKNKTLKYTFITSNIILFLLIGFSRVYLNVHWISDVIAGFSLGLFFITFFILIFELINSIWKHKINLIKEKIKERYGSY